MTNERECPKCKTQVTPSEKMECPTCKIQPQTDPFAASCSSFAGMLKNQMIFAVPSTLQSMMSQTPWGQMSFSFTPVTGTMLGLVAVIALAWFMVRQKTAVQVWGPIMVGVAALSLLGRANLLFGNHEGIPFFALFFVVLGAIVDVGVAVSAIAAFKAWRVQRKTA